MRTKIFKICTRRPMETINQVNRKTEITSGNSTQMLMCLDMVKRESRMELPWHSMLSDMKTNSQKQQL